MSCFLIIVRVSCNLASMAWASVNYFYWRAWRDCGNPSKLSQQKQLPETSGPCTSRRMQVTGHVALAARLLILHERAARLCNDTAICKCNLGAEHFPSSRMAPDM